MIYDTIILGGGPAGYTSAIYCARAGLKVAVIEKLTPGGQLATTEKIENYPGFPNGVGGMELADDMCEQSEKLGSETIYSEIKKVDLSQNTKKIELDTGDILSAKSVIIALGAYPRELGLPEEKSLRGKGVSYCATCDGMFFKGKEVVIVGGGDTAAADALYLSNVCSKVTLIHRRNTLRAGKAYLKPLENAKNIVFMWDSVVTKITGEPVNSVTVKNVNTEEEKNINCSGVFIAVGNVPNTELIKEQIKLTEKGYVDATENAMTNIEGVFVAGDIRNKPLRQVTTAVSDGAVAAYQTEQFLSKK